MSKPLPRSQRQHPYYVSQRAVDEVRKRQPAPGILLQELRRTKRLTQTAAAKEIGISGQYLCGLEKGWVLPGLSTLHRIAKLYDVSVDGLLR
jgi:DNA-binding XRE family transcriptional regulator